MFSLFISVFLNISPLTKRQELDSENIINNFFLTDFSDLYGAEQNSIFIQL